MSTLGKIFGYHVSIECENGEKLVHKIKNDIGLDAEESRYQTPKEVQELSFYNIENGEFFNPPEINETFITLKKNGKYVAYARITPGEKTVLAKIPDSTLMSKRPDIIRISTKDEEVYKSIIEKLPTKCVIQSTPWRDLLGYNAEIEMKHVKADKIKKFLEVSDSSYRPASKRFIPSGIGRGWQDEFVYKPAKLTTHVISPGTWIDGMYANRVDVFVHENSGKVLIRSHDVNAMRFILNMLESHFGPKSH